MLAATSIAFIENIKSEIISPLISFLYAISIILFLYGVFQFMQEGDAKKMEKGKMMILWGLIGLFVIVTFRGIMGFVQDTVNSLK